MSRKEVFYRRAAAGDIAALRSLHRASLCALGAAHYSPRQIAGLFLTKETVEPAMIEHGRLVLAESGGRIVGSGAWTPPVIAGAWAPATATIRSVFVAPDQARRGIARAIMDIVEADAVLHGRAVRLELLATLPGEPFYRALGYHAAGPHIEVPLVNGTVFPALRMLKTVLPEEPRALAA